MARYRFDEETLDALLHAAGVSYLDANHVLHGGGRQFRRPTGAFLEIAGRGLSGALIGIALIEEDDDWYLVLGVRLLTPAEAAVMGPLLEER